MGPESCPLSADPRLVGDPVDTLTGAVLDQMLDFRLIGPLEIRWTRHYNSQQAQSTFSIGRGSAHEYDRSLTLDADGIRYEEAARRSLRFPALGRNGANCALYGYEVTRLSSNRFTVEGRSQPSMEFRFAPGHSRARISRLRRDSSEVRFHYDSAERLVGIDDSAGRRIEASEDDAGRLLLLRVASTATSRGFLLIEYSYDADGCLVETRNHRGHGYSFAYDSDHRMVLRRGRQGFQFRFSYDEEGRCRRAVGDQRLYGVFLDYAHRRKRTKVTRPDGGVWSYTFTSRGELEKLIDPRGAVRTYVRSPTGRLLLEIDPNGNATKFAYDGRGDAVARVEPPGRWVAMPEDPNAPDAAFHRVPATPAEYLFGRLPDRHDRALPGEEMVEGWPVSAQIRSVAFHRPRGRPAEIADRGFDVPPLRTLWWPPPREGRIFDDFGKLVGQKDDFGRSRQWSYDASGNPVTYVDFDGGKWSYEYSLWHFLTRFVNPVGASVQCSYTAYGLLASCTDAGGSCSEYVYDLSGYLVEIRRDGTVKERYTRDACGNLVAKHDGEGRLLLGIEIGRGNLPVKKHLASGEEHGFKYDEVGRQLEASTSKDVVTFAYDSFGNCVCELRNGLGVEVDFGPPGTPDLVFAGAFKVSYTRDSAQTVVITDPMGGAHHLRRAAGGLLELQFSNGSVETCQLDIRGRILLKHLNRRLQGRTWTRRYHWSGEGELLRVEDSEAKQIRHEYDAAHRLTRRIADDRVEEFCLDLADNLISQPGLTGVELLAGNRLKSANGFRFSYDSRRHVGARETAEGLVRYVYDSRDQLVAVRMPRGDWTAEYDALGRRVRKTWKGKSTEFYWRSDQLIAELDAEGRLRLYVYTDSLAVVPLLVIDYESTQEPVTSGRRYFVYTDQVGAPRLIEDDLGNVVWSAVISPYGRADVEKTSTIEFNLRLPGHYFDTELGLDYNRFRYYDPELGRYLQSDPWGVSGGANLYAYRTNPLLVADVRGLGEEHGPDGKKVPKDEEGNHISPLTGEPVEGSVKVCQKTENGEVVARYYVDDKGRTVRAEGLLNPPASYEKSGVGHVMPEGFESGRDHRGHLIPERSAASQPAVNVPENVIAEHGTKSNLSEKKRWENGAREHSENNPGTWSVHEPSYDGDNPRPSSVTHSLTDSDGNPVPNSSKTIPNPED